MLARDIMNEKRPDGSSINCPFAFGPQRSLLVPSLLVSIDDANVQFPMSRSLSDFCWAIAPEVVVVPTHNARTYSNTMLRRFMTFLPGFDQSGCRQSATWACTQKILHPKNGAGRCLAARPPTALSLPGSQMGLRHGPLAARW